MRCTCTGVVTELASERRIIQLCMGWVGYFVSVEDKYRDHEPENRSAQKVAVGTVPQYGIPGNAVTVWAKRIVWEQDSKNRNTQKTVPLRLWT